MFNLNDSIEILLVNGYYTRFDLFITPNKSDPENPTEVLEISAMHRSAGKKFTSHDVDILAGINTLIQFIRKQAPLNLEGYTEEID